MKNKTKVVKMGMEEIYKPASEAIIAEGEIMMKNYQDRTMKKNHASDAITGSNTILTDTGSNAILTDTGSNAILTNDRSGREKSIRKLKEQKLVSESRFINEDRIRNLESKVAKIDIATQDSRLIEEFAVPKNLISALFKLAAADVEKQGESPKLTSKDQKIFDPAKEIESEINKINPEQDKWFEYRWQIEEVISALDSEIQAEQSIKTGNVIRQKIQTQLSNTEALEKSIQDLKRDTENASSKDAILQRIIANNREWQQHEDYLRNIISTKSPDIKGSQPAIKFKEDYDSEVKQINEKEGKYSEDLLSGLTAEEKEALNSQETAYKETELKLAKQKYDSALAGLENDALFEHAIKEIKKLTTTSASLLKTAGQPTAKNALIAATLASLLQTAGQKKDNVMADNEIPEEEDKFFDTVNDELPEQSIIKKYSYDKFRKIISGAADDKTLTLQYGELDGFNPDAYPEINKFVIYKNSTSELTGTDSVVVLIRLDNGSFSAHEFKELNSTQISTTSNTTQPAQNSGWFSFFQTSANSTVSYLTDIWQPNSELGNKISEAFTTIDYSKTTRSTVEGSGKGTMLTQAVGQYLGSGKSSLSSCFVKNEEIYYGQHKDFSELGKKKLKAAKPYPKDNSTYASKNKTDSSSHRQPTTNPLSAPSILKIVTGAAITALNGSIVSRNISNIGSGNGSSIKSYISTTLSNRQSLPQGGNYLLPPPPNYGNLISQPFGNSYLPAIDLYNLPPAPNSQLTPFFTDPLIAELAAEKQKLDSSKSSQRYKDSLVETDLNSLFIQQTPYQIFEREMYASFPKLKVVDFSPLKRRGFDPNSEAYKSSNWILLFNGDNYALLSKNAVTKSFEKVDYFHSETPDSTNSNFFENSVSFASGSSHLISQRYELGDTNKTPIEQLKIRLAEILEVDDRMEHLNHLVELGKSESASQSVVNNIPKYFQFQSQDLEISEEDIVLEEYDELPALIDSEEILASPNPIAEIEEKEALNSQETAYKETELKLAKQKYDSALAGLENDALVDRAIFDISSTTSGITNYLEEKRSDAAKVLSSIADLTLTDVKTRIKSELLTKHSELSKATRERIIAGLSPIQLNEEQLKPAKTKLNLRKEEIEGEIEKEVSEISRSKKYLSLSALELYSLLTSDPLYSDLLKDFDNIKDRRLEISAQQFQKDKNNLEFEIRIAEIEQNIAQASKFVETYRQVAEKEVSTYNAKASNLADSEISQALSQIKQELRISDATIIGSELEVLIKQIAAESKDEYSEQLAKEKVSLSAEFQSNKDNGTRENHIKKSDSLFFSPDQEQELQSLETNILDAELNYAARNKLHKQRVSSLSDQGISQFKAFHQFKISVEKGITNIQGEILRLEKGTENIASQISEIITSNANYLNALPGKFSDQKILKEIIASKLSGLAESEGYKAEEERLQVEFTSKKETAARSIPPYDLNKQQKSHLTKKQKATRAEKIKSYQNVRVALVEQHHLSDLFTTRIDLVSKDIIAKLPQALTQANKSSANIEVLLLKTLDIQPIDPALQAQDRSSHLANLRSLLPEHVTESYVTNLLESAKTAEGFTNLVAQQESKQKELKNQENFIETEISTLQRIYQENSQSPTLQEKLLETVEQSQEQIEAIKANLKIRHQNERLDKQEEIAQIQIQIDKDAVEKFKEAVANSTAIKTSEFNKQIGETKVVDIRASALKALQKAKETHLNLTEEILIRLIDEKYENRVSEEKSKSIRNEAEEYIQSALLDQLTEDQKLLLSESEKTGFENSRDALAELPRTLYEKKAQEKIDNLKVELLTASVNEQLAFDQAAADYLLQQNFIIQNALVRSNERIDALKSETSLDLKFKNRFPNLTDTQRTALIQKFSDPNSDVSYTTEKGRITAAHRIELKNPHIQSVINGLTPGQVELLPSDQFELLKSNVAALQSLEKKLSDRELAKKITDLTLEWQVGKANEKLVQINYDITTTTNAINEESKELQTQLDENPEFDVAAGIAKIIAEFSKLSPKGKAAATDFAQAQLQLLPHNQFAQTTEDATIQAHRENYQRAAARLIKIHQEKETEINASKFQLSAEENLLGANETKSSFEAAEKDRFESSLMTEERRFENEITALKLRYLSQIVVTKITENLQAIEELASQVKSSKIDAEELLIKNEINVLAAIKPEETTLATVVDYISNLEIAETSKTRLSKISADAISARIAAMSLIEPEGEVIRGFQEKLQSERQRNADFVNNLRQNIAAELKPFLTQDSLTQFESFKDSLNEKTELLYQVRYNQAKNAAIGEALSGDIIAQIKHDIERLDLSLAGVVPRNCDAKIQNLREAIYETQKIKIDKEARALEKAKEVYTGFESLSVNEKKRLTERFNTIISEADGSISEEKKTEIRSNADEKLDLTKSTNAVLIKEFTEGLSESRGLLKTAAHQEKLDDAQSFLDRIATKLRDTEVKTEINNLEAEALATNVETRIENDLAAIENSKKAIQAKIDKIAGLVGKIDEPAAIEDTTFDKVTLKPHLLFEKQLPETTIKEIIKQELEGLKSDSVYQKDVASRKIEHQSRLDIIKDRKFSPKPTQKLLFTDAMQNDFDKQASQFKDHVTDQREKRFRIKSAKKDAESLTNRVNTRLKKDISAAKSFIKDSAVKIEEGTNSLTLEINSILPPIDVEKSTFDAIKKNGQFNFLQSEALSDLLKKFIASEAKNLTNDKSFKTEQKSVEAEHCREIAIKFKSTEVEKLKKNLTSNDLLLLNGSEEFKSFEVKFTALKDLESEFSAKQLAAKLEKHKTEFLIKSTSENLTTIFKVAATKYAEEPSTKEEWEKKIYEEFLNNGLMFGAGMITGGAAIAILFLAKDWYSTQATGNDKPKNTPKPNPSLAGVAKIIPLVNKNAKKDEEKTKQAKTHQTADWNNNKKLLNVLRKVADCDFDNLKKALNADLRKPLSGENENLTLLKNLNLTSGDLAVLDAIDELHNTNRARDNFTAKNSKRENLKEFMDLIPENGRKEFFAFDKDKDVELFIIKPGNSPSNPTANKLEKSISARQQLN